MTLLLRTDGEDWREVRRLGFTHVDGMVFEADETTAERVAREQPDKWEIVESVEAGFGRLAAINAAGELGRDRPKAGTITPERDPGLVTPQAKASEHEDETAGKVLKEQRDKEAAAAADDVNPNRPEPSPGMITSETAFAEQPEGGEGELEVEEDDAGDDEDEEEE